MTLSLLTALFSVIASLFTAGTYYLDRNSHTSVIVAGADENTISLFLSNTGSKPSVIGSSHLVFDELPVKNVDLFFADQSKDQRVIPPGSSTKIMLMTFGGLHRKVSKQEIERLIDAGRKVTLLMEVHESNDPSTGFWKLLPPRPFHYRKDTVPAVAIRAFIEAKLVPE